MEIPHAHAADISWCNWWYLHCKTWDWVCKWCHHHRSSGSLLKANVNDFAFWSPNFNVIIRFDLVENPLKSPYDDLNDKIFGNDACKPHDAERRENLLGWAKIDNMPRMMAIQIWWKKGWTNLLWGCRAQFAGNHACGRFYTKGQYSLWCPKQQQQMEMLNKVCMMRILLVTSWKS